MIANLDKVIEWLEDNGLEYWTVLTKEGDNNKVFETSDDESLEDRKSRFRRVMAYCQGNRFIIKAKRDIKAGRGMFTEEFRNNPDAVSSTNSIGGMQVMPSLGYISPDELDKRLREREERILERVKYDRISEENKELRERINEVDNTTNRVIKKIEPYIGPIIGNISQKLFPNTAQVGVAGIDNPEDVIFPTIEDSTETETETSKTSKPISDQERLTRALTRWVEVEPDMIQLIEVLASMAVNKDSMYTMAKGMLIK